MSLELLYFFFQKVLFGWRCRIWPLFIWMDLNVKSFAFIQVYSIVDISSWLVRIWMNFGLFDRFCLQNWAEIFGRRPIAAILSRWTQLRQKNFVETVFFFDVFGCLIATFQRADAIRKIAVQWDWNSFWSTLINLKAKRNFG